MDVAMNTHAVMLEKPKSWTEQTYSNLIYWNEAEHGGHSPRSNSRTFLSRKCVPRFEN